MLMNWAFILIYSDSNGKSLMILKNYGAYFFIHVMLFACVSAFVFVAFSGCCFDDFLQSSFSFWLPAQKPDMRKMQHLPSENLFFKVRSRAGAASTTNQSTQKQPKTTPKLCKIH